MGRYALLPCTTKRRTTTNLKTKSNQNCQKIKLCGSLTTKEIKKTHSSRPVGRAETGSWVERTLSKAVAGGPSAGVDCAVGQARLQLADKAAAGRPREVVAGGVGSLTFTCR